MYIPDCDNCEHYFDCAVKKSLKEARETIFNIGREKAGREDFVLDGKRILAQEAEDE